MVLTQKQEQGLKTILTRYKNKEKYTVISGYAGTGKSTLVNFAIQALPVKKEEVAYATFTGKAAEVLRKKGNPGACTLHKLLYDFIPRKDGGFFRKIKRTLSEKVIVVDEVSMVPNSMIELLMKHNVYVIFLGDPFQLPQIDKNEENHLLEHPHVFLDEIMRQAEESEIIRLTMKIRNGEPIKHFTGKDVLILPKKNLNTGMLTWADQVIVATNKTRKNINTQMREMLGFSGLPQEGEKLICLKNYWDDINCNGNALVNGTIGIVRNSFENFFDLPYYFKVSNSRIPLITTDFIPDGDSPFYQLNIDKKFIMEEQPFLDWKTSYQLGKMKNKIGDVVPKEFAFAYAITCHKAQGSEWDKVLTLEENFPFDKTEHARWLYTACTRASKKLVLILKN